MKTTFSAICIFIAALVTMPLQAQTIKQQGVTYRYNGKNKRTPIGGVYIKAITANNSEVSDEKTGAFTLALNNLKMGSRIGNVRVTKQGMMVFNQQAVDEWSVRKDPLCLILCNAEDFQKQKDNLIAIGRNEAKKKYDKQLVELKRQNDAKQLQIDEYYNKLDSLDKEYQNALKHMDEYADVFARIDESEVDTIAQRAIELFNKGEIEESIRLLEQQDYIGKIKKANRTIEQADELISTAEQAKTLAELDKQNFLEGIKTQIAGYKLQNEWNKAKELLKSLADELNTLEYIWNYAVFCQSQNDFTDAENYFLKYIKSLQESYNINTINKMSSLLMTQTNLAILYSDTQRYQESETMYKAALKIQERLAKTNTSAFEPSLAIIQMNLANLYNRTQRYQESETMCKNALEIRERLAKANPSAFEPDLAMTQMNLAILYNDTKRYQESETMYKAALKIQERLAKTNPSTFEPSLATTQMNLATLYSDTYCYQESETMYMSALEIYERLAKINPSTFEPSLAMTQTNLATLYSNTQRYQESETMLRAALEIRDRLAKVNPSAFEPDLAITQMNFANLYYRTQRYQESETMYKNALGIYERLAEISPQIYNIKLARCYYRLGHTMLSMEKYHEASEFFKLSLILGKQMILSGKDTNIYMQSLLCLLLITEVEKDYVSAYKYNEELQLFLKGFYERNSDKWRSEYSELLAKKAFLSNLLGKFQEGELYSQEALKIDSTKYLAYTNLAAAMLFQGKTEEAEKLYRQYKGEFKDSMLDDFAEFERLGIIPKERKSDVERIKVILKE